MLEIDITEGFQPYAKSGLKSHVDLAVTNIVWFVSAI